MTEGTFVKTLSERNPVFAVFDYFLSLMTLYVRAMVLNVTVQSPKTKTTNNRPKHRFPNVYIANKLWMALSSSIKTVQKY